jgi:hypothetical protein
MRDLKKTFLCGAARRELVKKGDLEITRGNLGPVDLNII